MITEDCWLDMDYDEEMAREVANDFMWDKMMEIWYGEDKHEEDKYGEDKYEN